MQITNRHLLNFLLIDEKVRQETLVQMNNYTPDQNLELSKLLWMMFYELIHLETKYEFEKALIDIKDGKRRLGQNLYKQIKEQVFARFIRDLHEEQEADTVKELRERLMIMTTEKLRNKFTS